MQGGTSGFAPEQRHPLPPSVAAYLARIEAWVLGVDGLVHGSLFHTLALHGMSGLCACVRVLLLSARGKWPAVGLRLTTATHQHNPTSTKRSNRTQVAATATPTATRPSSQTSSPPTPPSSPTPACAPGLRCWASQPLRPRGSRRSSPRRPVAAGPSQRRPQRRRSPGGWRGCWTSCYCATRGCSWGSRRRWWRGARRTSPPSCMGWTLGFQRLSRW